MGQEGSRFALLDSLRFVAAGLVVFQHLFEHRPGFAGENLVPLGPGVAGVALFFFISGYVIPLSVGPRLELRSFFLRRLFRIYPLFLAALALVFAGAAAGLLPTWSVMLHARPFDWVANLLLVQEFVGARIFLGVSWTLAIEMGWYALFALTLCAFSRRAGDMLDIAVPAGVVAMAAISLIVETRLPLGRPIMVYAAVIGYQMCRYHQGEIGSTRLVRSVAIFALVTGAANYVSFGIFDHPSITLAQALGPWAISTAIFVAAMLLRPFREASWLNAGVAPRLGAMSYSTYLLHPVAMAAAELYAPGGLRVPLALLATLLLSVAGYRFIERPGIALGRRLAHGQRRLTAEAQPA